MADIRLFQYLEFVGTFLSIILNVLLLYLIYRYSKKEYGNYIILMLNLVSLYIFYSAIELVVLPSYFIYEYNYLLFTTSFTEFQKVSQYLIAIYCASFACMQIVLAAQFVYRYLSMAINPVLRDKIFSGYRHSMWMTFTFLFFCNWFFVGYSIFGYTNEYPKELGEIVQLEFGRNIEDMSYVLVNYAKLDIHGVPQPNYRHIYFIIYLIICASIPITISIFCGVKIFLKMRIEAFFKSAKRVQQEKQLFYVLIIQFVVPFICNTIPMLILFLSPAIHVSPEPYTNYICMFIALYPAFDAIATILIIRDYYEGFLKTFGLSKFFKHSNTMLPNLKVGSISVTSRRLRGL